MMHNRVLQNVISSICFLLSLSLFVLLFSGCDIDSRDKVIATVWNKDHITVNGNEYVLVANDNFLDDSENEKKSYRLINNGTWSWEYSLDKMNEIGKEYVKKNQIPKTIETEFLTRTKFTLTENVSTVVSRRNLRESGIT